jgi:hypothetical protein
MVGMPTYWNANWHITKKKARVGCAGHSAEKREKSNGWTAGN